MKTGVVLVAGGRGERLKSDLPKAFVHLGGKPLFQHSLDSFLSHPQIDEIVLVVPKGSSLDYCSQMQESRLDPLLVAGGVSRQTSVYNGLLALSPDIDAVLVHDAARPFVTHSLIDSLIGHLKRGENAIAAILVNDTLKLAQAKGDGAGEKISKTVDRKGLWRAQTPQAFLRSVLVEAYALAVVEEFMGTDEASLVERIGAPIYLVSASPLNIKITTPEDLQLAQTILDNLGRASGKR